MPTTALFDPDFIRRYDEAGPRYTSYPTAPHFHDGFGEAELRRHARRSNTGPTPRPISLYVHIPYCTSPCFYCGCNRIITRDFGKGERYVERLLREFRHVADLFDRDREVVQVHFGGGSPNFLRPAQIGQLLDGLAGHFRFSRAPERDFSIELDPRHVAPSDIAELAALGINRASLGVQDFNPIVQEAIHRIQSVEQTLAVIGACRDHGLRSVNVDLIYGLPKQTIEGFRETLDTVIEAQPDRVAIYGYAHLPKMFKAQKQIRDADLPDAGARLDLLALAVEHLSAAGYEYIGVDHFALPGDDLALAQRSGRLHRNFMGYTTHADSDLVGFGVSAISHIGASYSQNPRDITGWELALDEGRLPVWRGRSLDLDDELRAWVIQGLMCRGEVDIKGVERRFHIDFGAYFADDIERLGRLVDDGLVEIDAASIRATARGRYLLRVIAMCFDRYLHRSETGASTAQFSRAL